MTTPRSILVHLDTSPRCRARLELAQALGEHFDAEVTALFAALPAQLQYPFSAGVDLQVTPRLQDFEIERAQRARALFDAAVASGLSRLRWAELSADESLRAFSRRALYVDWLLLGQADPDAEAPPDVPGDFVETVLVDSGKPALLLPYIGSPSTLPRTVLVAWKATRESARALTAALPLLAAAQRVHVAMWDDGDSLAGAEAARIEDCLRRHGIAPTLHRYGPAPRELGDHLLSAASDLGADLLVMGCYGHARAREWVLGGASRTVLKSMTLPVLMVH